MIAAENWGNPHNWKQFVGKRVECGPLAPAVYDVLEVNDLQVRLKWVSGDPPVNGGEPFWETPQTALTVKEVPPPVAIKWEDCIGKTVEVQSNYSSPGKDPFPATVLSCSDTRVWLRRHDQWVAVSTHDKEYNRILRVPPTTPTRRSRHYANRPSEWMQLTLRLHA